MRLRKFYTLRFAFPALSFLGSIYSLPPLRVLSDASFLARPSAGARRLFAQDGPLVPALIRPLFPLAVALQEGEDQHAGWFELIRL
jgi:hypothetical protein